MPKISKLRLTGFFFLLMSAVVGLMLVFIPDVFPDKIPNYIFIIATISTFLFALFFMVILFNLGKNIFFWLTEDGKRHERILLDFDTPIPDHMLSLANNIENIGFTKLGVKALVWGDNTQQRHWLWLDDTKTIIAFLFENKLNEPFMYFSTIYENGFDTAVEYNIKIETNRSITVPKTSPSSIHDIYHRHTHLYDELQAFHKPRVFHSLTSTNLTIEEHKHNMRRDYATLIRINLRTTLLLGSVALSSLLIMNIPPLNSGIAIFGAFIFLGISFSAINFDVVMTSPIMKENR